MPERECLFDGLRFHAGDEGITVYMEGDPSPVAGPIENADLVRFANPDWDNDLQRARREGFEAGALFLHGNPTADAERTAQEAARRYPLRVLRPRQVTVAGVSVSGGEAGSVVLDFPGWPPKVLTRAVADAVHDLSHNPREWVDNTNPEP